MLAGDRYLECQISAENRIKEELAKDSLFDVLRYTILLLLCVVFSIIIYAIIRAYVLDGLLTQIKTVISGEVVPVNAVSKTVLSIIRGLWPLLPSVTQGYAINIAFILVTNFSQSVKLIRSNQNSVSATSVEEKAASRLTEAISLAHKALDLEARVNSPPEETSARDKVKPPHKKEDGEEEQRTKITVRLEEKPDNQLEIMDEIFKIINLALKFDSRDSPYDGTKYSLIQAGYLTQRKRENGSVPLTLEDQIMAKRLSRSFRIMCIAYFLEDCSSVPFYANLHGQFLKAVGESELGALKTELIDRSYIGIYQDCSNLLAKNNGGQDIKSLVEAISSAYMAKLETVGGPIESEFTEEQIINYLKQELLF